MKRCPMCAKPLIKPVRFCRKCKTPILGHHKFTIQGHGLEHRHSDYPEEYIRPEVRQ